MEEDIKGPSFTLSHWLPSQILHRLVLLIASSQEYLRTYKTGRLPRSSWQTSKTHTLPLQLQRRKIPCPTLNSGLIHYAHDLPPLMRYKKRDDKPALPHMKERKPIYIHYYSVYAYVFFALCLLILFFRVALSCL